MNFAVIADELDTMQAKENNGRGVQCVHAIVVYLKRGDIGSAESVANNENDKIRNYPAIQKVLYRCLPEYRKRALELINTFGWEMPENLKEFAE